MNDVLLVPIFYMSSTATHSVVLIKKQNENRCSTDGEMSNFAFSFFFFGHFFNNFEGTHHVSSAFSYSHPFSHTTYAYSYYCHHFISFHSLLPFIFFSLQTYFPFTFPSFPLFLHFIPFLITLPISFYFSATFT